MNMKLTALQVSAILAYTATTSPVAAPLSTPSAVAKIFVNAPLPTNLTVPEDSKNVTATTTGDGPEALGLLCDTKLPSLCPSRGKPPKGPERPSSGYGDYATKWQKSADGSWDDSADVEDTPDHRACSGEEHRDFLLGDLDRIVDREYKEPVEVLEMEGEWIQCLFGIPRWGASKGVVVESYEVERPEHDDHDYDEHDHDEQEHEESKHDKPKPCEVKKLLAKA